ncbi:MAG: hypothetical protein ACYSUY_00410 [Planctomycetota bacterium]|jgi:RNA polymerase sigma-70 factor (ECF subfamily)
MRRFDKTSMGGEESTFQTTDWSEIRNAKTFDETRRKEIVGSLLRKYWKPVYCYLRFKGYANEPAKDLTQGFFYEIVLGRELVQQADQAKGRFRTFLLIALSRYVTDVHRIATAKKRIPKDPVVQLEAIELPNLPTGQTEERPEQGFYYAWAADLLDEVLGRVRSEYCSTGRVIHWQVFQAKVLEPIFQNTKAPSLAEICTKYGVDSEDKASNLIVTVKRRFRTVLKRCLRHFVQSDSEVEEEFNELIKILSMGSAR